METTVLVMTREELEAFKKDLIASIKEILCNNSVDNRRYIKARELRAMLQISENSLRALVVSNDLQRIRLGKSYYFDRDQVLKLLERNKSSD